MVDPAGTLRHYPLGACFTDSPHAVISSIPTLRDVEGYETGDPAVLARLHLGYPRFVRHHLIKDVCARLAGAQGAQAASFFICPVDPAMVEALDDYAGPAKWSREEPGFSVLAYSAGGLAAARAKNFLQHTGALISSRQAERWLAGPPLDAKSQSAAASDAAASDAALTAQLLPWLSGAAARDVTITRNGANAAFAAYQAADALQAGRGRDQWVQLGWLYIDTGQVLNEWSRRDAGPKAFVSVRDLDALEAYLDQEGARVAGIVCEAPSNPLLETCDLLRLRALARKYGVLLLLDPTVTSLVNIDALPLCDILICSLTKYAAQRADVMGGVIAVNPAGPDAEALRAAIAAAPIARLFVEDAAVLLAQISGMAPMVRAVNANTCALVNFLERHPRAHTVRHALQASTRANYAAVARAPDSPGGLLSFSVRGEMRPVFDALRLPKAASFGAAFTIVSPFMYLAHYDLVRTAEGRARLATLGIDPDLLRVSVGAEPIDALIAVFSEALA